MNVREVFTPKKMSASGALLTGHGSLGGVLCTTAGTFNIEEGTDGNGTEVVANVTGVVGTFYPLPFAFANGAYTTIAGGFVGTFAVGQG